MTDDEKKITGSFKLGVQPSRAAALKLAQLTATELNALGSADAQRDCLGALLLLLEGFRDDLDD